MHDINRLLMGVRSKGAIIARTIVLHSINIVSLASPLSDQVFQCSRE